VGLAPHAAGHYNSGTYPPRPVINVGQIDQTLLEILACPVCHSAIRQEGDWLVCDECRLKYPVRDGLPVMLPEEAVKSDEDPAEGSGDAR